MSKVSGPSSTVPDEKVLRRLHNQIDRGHFGPALKTCSKYPADTQLAKIRTWLQIQTEDLDNLNIDELPAFERAYVNYRLHRPVSLDGCDGIGPLHIEAQSAYRQGDYAKACEIYGSLLDEVAGEEAEDVTANLHAAEIGRDWVPPSSDVRWDSAPPVMVPSGPVKEVNIIPGAMKKVRKDEGDPERWLKKTERTTYHAKGKGRKGYGAGATQGASLAEDKGQGKNVKGKKKR